MTGTPIIAPKTGGLTRQVVDHRDETHNGVALDIDFKTMVGSQTVPYIYEDYVHNENFASAMMKLFNMSKKDKYVLSKKVKNYANSEFSQDKTINAWHETMTEAIEKFSRRKNWQIEEV